MIIKEVLKIKKGLKNDVVSSFNCEVEKWSLPIINYGPTC